MFSITNWTIFALPE